MSAKSCSDLAEVFRLASLIQNITFSASIFFIALCWKVINDVCILHFLNLFLFTVNFFSSKIVSQQFINAWKWYQSITLGYHMLLQIFLHKKFGKKTKKRSLKILNFFYTVCRSVVRWLADISRRSEIIQALLKNRRKTERRPTVASSSLKGWNVRSPQYSRDLGDGSEIR
jgi:hypothetical protein